MSVQALRGTGTVLIAGGGLVGLSTAMFLAQHGIASLAVGTPARRLAGAAGGAFPPANARAVSLGRDRGRGQAPVGEGILAGRRHRRDGQPRRPQARRHHSEPQCRGRRRSSPCRRLFVTQPGLEPILRKRARQAGAEVLEGSEIVAIEQDADGVTATVQGRRQRHTAHAASEISGRRRWRAQQGARIARHPVRRPRRVLQQHHDLFHRRSGAADARQAAERDLHQQSAVRRLLPPGEGLPVRISGGEHGRRSEDQSGRRQRREGHQRASGSSSSCVPVPACPTCR